MKFPPADTPDPKRPPHGDGPPEEPQAPPEVIVEALPGETPRAGHFQPPPETRLPRSYRALAGLLGLGIVVLLVALIWLVLKPVQPPEDETALLALRQQVAAMSQNLETITQRLAALEQKPAPAAPPPPNLAPLESRIAKLEQAPPPPKTDLAPLTARIDTVAGRTEALAGDVQKSQAAQAALAATLTASLKDATASLTSSMQGAQTALSNQIGATSQHVQALEDRVAASQTALGGRLDADEKRIATAEQAGGQVAGLAARTARTERLRAASTALEAGQPLGEIPGASPALQRYATAAPPTEAALRLSFTDAARAAEVAQAPNDQNSSFAAKMWANVSQAVTIRDGDHVIVGGSAAPTLARARHLLEAGDLAGAVGALGTLTGPPADAMAGWLAQARNLLAARTALADLTAHG